MVGAAIGVAIMGGLGAMAVGGGMWVIGSVKVSRVVASISPTGCALRVTF